MRVAVIGCGAVGARRAAVIRSTGFGTLAAACDTNLEHARAIADDNTRVSSDWSAIVADPTIDVVIVATPTAWHCPIGTAALASGKHVLCEKPPGRNKAEATALVNSAQSAERVLAIGLNHRFYDHIATARGIVQSGEIGDVTAMRMVYGHGGRVGYEHEWRLDPTLSGGGELLDQGIHLVDLCCWFLGPISDVTGIMQTAKWSRPIGPLIEDNAFALLHAASGAVAQLHVSWTQWRNCFTIDVLGRTGYIQLSGLHSAYGPPRLTIGHVNQLGGAPEESLRLFEPCDPWTREWCDVANAIARGGRPPVTGEDGLYAMSVIDAIYQAHAHSTWVSIQAEQ